MTTWTTITIDYRDLGSRRALVTEVLPRLARDLGGAGWFFADTITPGAARSGEGEGERAGDGDVGDGDGHHAASGQIEAAIAVDTAHTEGAADAVRTALDATVSEGAATGWATLPRPRLLDPVRFSGSTPLAVYTGLLFEGTERAVAILEADASPAPAQLAAEVEAFLALVDAGERALLADHLAGWLEAAARGAADPTEAARAAADAAGDAVPGARAARGAPMELLAGTTVTPLRSSLVDAFAAERESLPTAQRYELVARLAHIQARRLDPGLSLDDEAALVRALLAVFAHRATRQS